MNSHEGIENYLKTIIKVGVVEEFFPESSTAAVRFPDEKDFKSGPLRILHPNAGNTRDFNVLAKGENVLCLFLPTGRERGFILGALYRDPFPPAESDAHTRSVVFPDGTRVAYDWESKKMDVDCRGDITMKATGNISLKAGGGLSIHADGGTSCTGGGSFSIRAASIHLNEGGD